MLRIVNMGLVPYKEALDVQKEIQRQRILGECEDTLLLLEHPPVLTKGIRSSDDNILLSEQVVQERGVAIHKTHRGGDVTYHGPGQVVGYIIMNIDGKERDIRRIVEKLEQVTINILKNEFDIKAHREDKKYTGVFVDTNKITAIGIAVKRRVTMHGFAMNVNTDLKYFDWIVPCGLQDRSVTSIEKLTGSTYDINHMKQLIREEIEILFDVPTYTVDVQTLYKTLGATIYETYMAKN